MNLKVNENTYLDIYVVNDEYLNLTTLHKIEDEYYYRCNEEMNGKYPPNFVPENIDELIEYLIDIKNSIK